MTSRYKTVNMTEMRDFCLTSPYVISNGLKCLEMVTYSFTHDSIAANALHATNNFQIIPDFSLKDSMDQTVLGLALWTGTQYKTYT